MASFIILWLLVKCLEGHVFLMTSAESMRRRCPVSMFHLDFLTKPAPNFDAQWFYLHLGLVSCHKLNPVTHLIRFFCFWISLPSMMLDTHLCLSFKIPDFSSSLTLWYPHSDKSKHICFLLFIFRKDPQEHGEIFLKNVSSMLWGSFSKEDGV